MRNCPNHWQEKWPRDDSRVYEKGENRTKHLGRSGAAEIVWDPRYNDFVGKCPKGFSNDEAKRLIQCAIPEYRDSFPDRPYALWNYHDGAIYKARTSDKGRSWHGFPDDDPPMEIREQLEHLARTRGEYRKLKKFSRASCKRK